MRRFFWQLFLHHMVIILFLLLVAGLYAFHTLKAHFHEQVRETLEMQVHTLAEFCREAMIGADPEDLDVRIKKLAENMPLRMTVILQNGRVIADSEEWPQNMNNHLKRPEIEQAAETGIGQATRYSSTLDKELMYVAAPVFSDARLIGFVRTSMALTGLSEALWPLRVRLFAGGVVAALLAFGVSLLLSQRISRPVVEAKEGAERFANGELTYRLHPWGTQETKSLAEAMNAMARQMDARVQTILEQQEKLQAVFTSIFEGVVVLDSNGHVLDMNPMAAWILGLDMESVKDKPIHGLVRKPVFLQVVDACLETGENIKQDVEIAPIGGDLQNIKVRATSLLSAQGRRIGALLVLHQDSPPEKN